MIDFEKPEDKAAFVEGIKQIKAEFETMDRSRDQIKEVINAVHDSTNVPKPMIRKVARLYHKQVAAQYQTEANEIKDLYKALSS